MILSLWLHYTTWACTKPQIRAIKTPTLFIKAAFKQFSHPTGKKVALLQNLYARQAGALIHNWTRETHRAGKWNFYKFLHKGDPKANLLLTFIASSTVGICAHGSTAVLMEISKQGHTCHRSCFSCSKNICGSCLLERQRAWLVLAVLAGCSLHLQLPGHCIPLRGNTLLNLLSTQWETKIITANFPLGHPLQTTKDSEDPLKQPLSPGKCHSLKNNCLSFN